ncbi:catalase [Umbelopsis sp. PMI_123]|nr:catalase [Umbelopsis sp. PMI_123]
MADNAPTILATPQTNVLTTSNGNPVDDNQNSLTAGEFGPILLQDFHLIDKLTHFGRERIPERIVHAKGAGAHGHFEVTANLSHLTSAKFLQTPGIKTPVFVRFSTVGGERGTSDSLRDVRGFAVKFYTEEGNWDMVGINTPVFWIRDPLKFPDLNHSQKRNPGTNLKDADMFWDFLSLTPESLHQVTTVFSNRGTPYSHRHMHGFGTHTFKLVNAQGVGHYVKWHFKTDQGIKNHTLEEAAELDGSNPDSSTEDLYNAIEKGDFPSWSVCLQVMKEEDAATYKWNIFDDTKVWPHADYPLQKIGKLTLDRNPSNYFAEVEQAAFSPSSMVPGIDVSNDRILQGRLFSYADTERHRLGPNFIQLPINQPYRAKVSNYQRDGLATYSENFGDRPNYEPQSQDPNGPQQQSQDIRDRFASFNLSGKTGRYPYHLSDDDFVQPRKLYHLLKGKEQDDLIKNIVGHIKHVKNPEIIKRQISLFARADPEWGRRVEEGVKAAGKKL